MIFSFISSEILIENCGKSCIIGNRANRETHRQKIQIQHTEATYRSSIQKQHTGEEAL